MIVQLFFVGLGIFVYLYYALVFKLKQLYDFYTKTMESLGHKVLKLPFKPLKSPLMERY